jgi:hypothetical protein
MSQARAAGGHAMAAARALHGICCRQGGSGSAWRRTRARCGRLRDQGCACGHLACAGERADRIECAWQREGFESLDWLLTNVAIATWLDATERISYSWVRPGIEA